MRNRFPKCRMCRYFGRWWERLWFVLFSHRITRTGRRHHKMTCRLLGHQVARGNLACEYGRIKKSLDWRKR